jgi:hypothetical protein
MSVMAILFGIRERSRGKIVAEPGANRQRTAYPSKSAGTMAAARRDARIMILV